MKLLPPRFVLVVLLRQQPFNARLRIERANGVRKMWTIIEPKFGHMVGYAFVFEREDAARLELKRRVGIEDEMTEHQLWFTRSLTARRAVKDAINRSGEMIDIHRYTPEQQAQLRQQRKDEEAAKYRHDIAKYRSVIESVHARNPQLSRAPIPKPDPEDVHREMILLNRYVIGLHRYGALANEELESLSKALLTHCSKEFYIEPKET